MICKLSWCVTLVFVVSVSFPAITHGQTISGGTSGSQACDYTCVLRKVNDLTLGVTDTVGKLSMSAGTYNELLLNRTNLLFSRIRNVKYLASKLSFGGSDLMVTLDRLATTLQGAVAAYKASLSSNTGPTGTSSGSTTITTFDPSTCDLASFIFMLRRRCEAVTTGCNTQCIDALRMAIGKYSANYQGIKCVKAIIGMDSRLPFSSLNSTQKMALMAVAPNLRMALECYLRSGASVPGVGTLPRPPLSCDSQFMQKVVTVMTTLKTACPRASDTEGTCSSCSSLACTLALRSSRMLLTDPRVGRCMANLTTLSSTSTSTSTTASRTAVDYLARAGRALSDCARLQGFRIPGFGGCSANGAGTDCSGLGRCLNRTVGCNTYFMCKCKPGYMGRFCEREVPLPRQVQLFRFKCPANRNGVPCSGNGRCINATLGLGLRYKKCQCKPGFFFANCNGTRALVQKLDQMDARRVAVAVSLQTAAAKAKACAAAGKYFCAGPLVLAAKRDSCVATPRDCYPATVTTALQTQLQSLRKACLNGSRTAGCSAVVPQRRCGPNEKRCATGQCAATCPTSSRCAAEGYACPDGITCAASEAECSASGDTWNGCATGQFSCPSNRRTCVSDLRNCALLLGCTQPLRFCGWQRQDGVALMNSSLGRPQPICKPRCSSFSDSDEPAFTRREITAGIRSLVTVLRTNSTRPAVKVVLNKVRTLLGATKFNFSATTVPDSLKANGAFRTFFARKTTLSTMVRFITGSALNISLGQLQMTFPVTDETANSDAASCRAVLANAAVYSTEYITDPASVAYKVANCVATFTVADGCTCGINSTHFSTYVVVDTQTNSAIADQQNLNAASLPSSGSGSTTGGSGSASGSGSGASSNGAAAVIGGVVGGLVAVGLALFVGSKVRRRGGSGAAASNKA